jgi:TRAP-type C4-dicarboxylate transport system permease large subunit
LRVTSASSLRAFLGVVYVSASQTSNRCARAGFMPTERQLSERSAAQRVLTLNGRTLCSYASSSEQIPQAMAAWMTSQGFGLVMFMLLVNSILLAAGNFMDPAAIVLIMAPILFPVAVKLGVDPVHFGILMAVNVEGGLCHPRSG